VFQGHFYLGWQQHNGQKASNFRKKKRHRYRPNWKIPQILKVIFDQKVTFWMFSCQNGGFLTFFIHHASSAEPA
jgi:hypothetical protein